MAAIKKRKKRKNKKKAPFYLIAVCVIAFVFVIMISDKIISRISYPIDYYEHIEKYSSLYEVPPQTVCAVIDTESSFLKDAVSNKGAIGLMQITPDTYEWLCTKIGEEPNHNKIYEPETNIKYGTFFLKILYEEFGDWETVFAAYNAGRSKVNSWLKNPEISNGSKLISIPYKETREYVKKVANTQKAYEQLYFQ